MDFQQFGDKALKELFRNENEIKSGIGRDGRGVTRVVSAASSRRHYYGKRVQTTCCRMQERPCPEIATTALIFGLRSAHRSLSLHVEMKNSV